jgi:hypothetical protein
VYVAEPVVVETVIQFIYYWLRLKWLRAKEPYLKWRHRRIMADTDAKMQKLKEAIERWQSEQRS